MDIDLEFEFSDRISDFLRLKLEDIKAENVQLEESIRHRQEILKTLRQELLKRNDDSVTLGEVWKKIINDNYVLGMEIKNENSSVLSNIEVILNSTSSSSLTYKVYVISSSGPFQHISQLPNSGQIIIVFPIPSFTDSLSHTLSGCVRFQKNNKKFLLQLPSSIPLTPQDVTDNSIIVHSYKVKEGSIKDLLALIFSSQKQEFVVVDPENLGHHLEVDCSLCKVNGPPQEELFLVQKISPLLDGTLLEVVKSGGKPQLNVYCKNSEVVISLLHYLYRQMLGALIIPKSVYQPDLDIDELTEALRSVLKEMGELKNFSGSSKELMLKMVELEIESDVLVARINKKQTS